MFRNREIWGFESDLLNETRDAQDGSHFKFIPPVAVKDAILEALRLAVTASVSTFDIPEFTMILGASGISGHRIALRNNFGNAFTGKIFVSEISCEAQYEDGFRVELLFNSFMTRLYQEAGASPDERSLAL